MATHKEKVQEIPAGELDYVPEKQLRDHIERFLTADEIKYLCANLRVADLREMAAEIVIASIEHVRGNTGQLEYTMLLNSWLATAEETVAAGKSAARIAARRKVESQDSE